MNRKNCIHQGFQYKPQGRSGKKTIIVCDLTGEHYEKSKCKNCDMYKRNGG